MSERDNFAVSAADPTSSEGVVLLLFRPDADGRIEYREWHNGSGDPSRRDPVSGIATADELEERLRVWIAAGWEVTQPLLRVTAWLRP